MIVYLIENRCNSKVYIGQTTLSLEKRWRRHQNDAKQGRQSPLYTAIRKYGPENFNLMILGQAENLNHLNEMEIACIELFDATDRNKGYNLLRGGIFHRTSQQMTDDGRKGGKIQGIANRENGHWLEVSRKGRTVASQSKGRHVRWHLKRNQTNSDCPYCVGETI